jgi:hypothetical protein
MQITKVPIHRLPVLRYHNALLFNSREFGDTHHFADADGLMRFRCICKTGEHPRNFHNFGNLNQHYWMTKAKP